MRNLLGRLYAIKFIRFCTVGALNAGVLLVIVNSLAAIFKVYEGFSLLILNTIAYACVVTMSYFLNKRWTFRHEEKHSLREFLVFAAITLIGLAIQNTILYWLTTLIGPLWGQSARIWLFISSALAIIISSFWNFFCYTFIVFKSEMNSQVTK